MEIEKKYISKKNWKRAVERIDIFKKVENKDLIGIVSLIEIKKVTEPSFKEYNGKILKIVDDGYYWLQIGFENKKYWITAMYNEKKEIVQYYIDITEKNVIDNYEKTFFYDMFLDVVMLPSGEIFLLDEEEIKQALSDNVITKKQYDGAYEESNRIIKYISNNSNDLKILCDKYFEILLKDIGE